VGDDAGLFLLNKGSGEVLASDFVASSRMRDVFETMRAEFDLIVIDTAPFTKVAYAGELVRHADGAIVVVPSGGNVGPVEEVAERLAVLGVEPTGYVYNGVRATDYKGRSEGSLRDRVGA
jgi:Mrp family chromosome partitioning ATPase